MMLSELIRALLRDHRQHPAVAGRTPPDPADITAVQISHRWLGRAVFVLFRSRDRTPWIVAKVDRHEPYKERLVVEHATLEMLAAGDEVTGLVPGPIGRSELPSGSVLFQTGCAGSPLTAVVRRRGRHRPRAGGRDHEAALAWFAWLRAWVPKGSTAEPPLALDVAGLADELRALLPQGLHRTAFMDELTSRGRELGHLTVPRVRIHGDPAPGNLLVRRGQRTFGLIDWESDTGPSSPLPDGLTFVNHYARATPLSGRPPTRHEAVARALMGEDDLGRLSRRTWRHLVVSSGLPAEGADLLAVRTLLDLATGRTDTAHRVRGRAMWTDLLLHTIEMASEDVGSWRRAWAADPRGS